MADTNATLARLFTRTAGMLQLTGANRFKVIAYEKAARILGELADDAGTLSDAELTAIDGIGKGIVERIREFVDTGRIAEHDQLNDAIPPGVVAMLNISGLGPKTAALLWREGGVTTLDELKAKLESGELTGLKGFGQKKAEQVLKSLAFAASAGDRVRLGVAHAVAQRFVSVLRARDTVQRVEVAGSLRRGKETIGDVDVLVAAAPGDAGAIADVFKAVDGVEEVIAAGETKTSVRCEPGIQVDLRVVEPAQFGAALMYFTGSKDHNVAMRERAQSMGMTLNEYGLWTAGKDTLIAAQTEEAVFEKLKLAWVAPELREDRGELGKASATDGGPTLPDLVELTDIRAELHCHTTASDGTWSIRDLVEACIEQGYHTVCITDHSKSQVQANGLNEDRLLQHIEAIRAVAADVKKHITVLAGSEVDILTDGRLDYADEVLEQLDLVVASPHASLAQDDKKATARLIKAIEHPAVTVLGHPTGRLVLRREGLHPDLKALCRAAADTDTALEINASSYRLDLRDTHARVALDLGCKLAINTDAHGPADLHELRFGVMTARRAGATKRDIVNCMSKAALAKWIGR